MKLLLLLFAVHAVQGGVIQIVEDVLSNLEGEDTGQEAWFNSHESCNGTRQSPVNIDCSHMRIDSQMGLLVFENYDQLLDGMAMVNDGHTVKVTVPPTAGIRLLCETLPAPYRLAQFHFHWGTGDRGGSEHTINGKRWPLELHLVHMNENIPPGEISTNKDAIVVVSILFDEVDAISSIASSLLFDNNEPPIDGIETLSQAATKVTEEGTSTTLTSFNITSLLPEDRTNNYLRYDGSLTTPPCSEVVEWIILTRTMVVRPRHLERFRSVRGHENERIKENTRPLQPLNDRPIRLLGDLGKSVPKC